MFRIILSATAALVASATPAFAEKTSFTQDGVTYVYTVTFEKGATVYTGTTSDGHDFRLVNHNGKVHGDVDGQLVLFSVDKADPVKVARR